MDTQKKYPFDEGDFYYVVENGEIVQSIWDSVSEEIHDSHPNRIYYATFREALCDKNWQFRCVLIFSPYDVDDPAPID
jgi:hypothetical protein